MSDSAPVVAAESAAEPVSSAETSPTSARSHQK